MLGIMRNQHTLMHHLVLYVEDLNLADKDVIEPVNQWGSLDEEEEDVTLCQTLSRGGSEYFYQYACSPAHIAYLLLVEPKEPGDVKICQACQDHPDFEDIMALEILGAIG